MSGPGLFLMASGASLLVWPMPNPGWLGTGSARYRIHMMRIFSLLTALTLMLLLSGRLIAVAVGGDGGEWAALIMLGMSVVVNLSAYWFSDSLAIKMTGARPLKPRDAPNMARIVNRLAKEFDLLPPRLFIIKGRAPNAFAAGRNQRHAVIGVTSGLLDLLNERELTAVLAHELGHIRNRDMLVMTVFGTLAIAISYLGNVAWRLFLRGMVKSVRLGLLLLIPAILLPLAAMLMQLAVSRARELGADDAAAKFARDPLALASALGKMEKPARTLKLKVHPAASHLFIVQPLLPDKFWQLFDTHPTVKERVARLKQLAAAMKLERKSR